ncbi:hypothetical protein JAAARDRAFT_470479 [Jaapia argillacea MUCL 33604]|uniref:tRNA-splicing endonuclease subunit Sen15 domain-containing protein n=1 Tax=Jaapia argillacea MUCL 33604 TaxID=933084 RepID=A0A067Q6Z6_9AGAM|nr:hypothetical protein JAAARDRAFT_470479 [Jaapia argillacea MUCL 33604]
MQNHASVSYPILSPYLSKYPRVAGAIFQTYNDLLLAQQWTDLDVVDLPSCSRCGFRGRRPQTEATLSVVPCSLAESISISWLTSALKSFHDTEHIYLAITAEDSSIVYYKISPGIVKPPI